VRLTDGVHLVGSGEIGLSDPFDAHVYLLDGGDDLALIDAGSGRGDSVAQIMANIVGDGRDPARISQVLLTHWHPDHAGGAASWRRKLPKVRVAASATETHILEHATQPGLERCHVDAPLENGSRLRVGHLQIDVIQVPGHSSGSVCYLVELPAGRALFTGDVVFMNGIIGLLNHPDSHLDRYRESIARLDRLQVELLFPGHMLFFLRGGQKHIDLAFEALKGDYVPYSVSQLGIDFRPPTRM
jgi:glyoxylase-like metal-dependent hydrolase (beta-lactamase superfamily II)